MEQPVDAAVSRDDGRNHRLDRGAVPHIHRQSLPAAFRGHTLGGIKREIGDDDPRPIPRREPGTGGADTGTTACYDNNFLRKQIGHRRSLDH